MKQTLATPRPLALNPNDREYGVIVTCSHIDGPPLWTFHIPGGSGNALKTACRMIDARGIGWRILSVSSPQSIYRDMSGTRQDHSVRESVGRTTGSSNRRNEDPRSYELMMLGRTGRLDLLAPLGWHP